RITNHASRAKGRPSSVIRDSNMKSLVLYVRRFFVDPLSVKELSGIARRWQTYVGRGLYVGLIGLIVGIFWMNLSRGGDWMSPSAYAELGRGLFYTFFAMQMVVVTFGGMSA